ncbi:type II toxin-antitoxin system ParD family antitoxin [Dyella subtropica]|uniref:type II toxin-antitoxin system ParD family antitoxin n=1 Tax=Dyella subtropica TaxID=2992127 RepID=UPI00225C1FD3|nr:type II toxin-antitoxin system ParD family antitoxin [Dyella subtropica]
MAVSQKLSISLPEEQAKFVEKLVGSGQYASASAVISDGLRALQARDAAMEKWLREEVMPAYHELVADPSKGITVAQMRAELMRRRRPRT